MLSCSVGIGSIIKIPTIVAENGGAISGILSAITSLLVLTFYSLFASWILRYFCLASIGYLDNVSLKTF